MQVDEPDPVYEYWRRYRKRRKCVKCKMPVSSVNRGAKPVCAQCRAKPWTYQLIIAAYRRTLGNYE